MPIELSPTDADWELAKETFDDFTCRLGAQHIATEFALAHLSALLRTKRPATVLEIGAGIGTITRLLLSHPVGVSHVTSTEDHPFCIEQIETNIPRDLRPRLELIKTPEDLNRLELCFDLIVLDGDVSSADGFSFMDKGTVCFVEGARSNIRNALNAQLAERGLICQFSNYNRGRKRVALVWRKAESSDMPIPKLKFNSVIKGCWVGEVVQCAANL